MHPEASRVNGYSRGILERDGDPAHEEFEAFAACVGDRPVMADKRGYDLDRVLIPEWTRWAVRRSSSGMRRPVTGAAPLGPGACREL